MKTAKTKISIICLPGLQSFLKDIVAHLSRTYEVQTCIDRDPQKIAETVTG